MLDQHDVVQSAANTIKYNHKSYNILDYWGDIGIKNTIVAIPFYSEDILRDE